MANAVNDAIKILVHVPAEPILKSKPATRCNSRWRGANGT